MDKRNGARLVTVGKPSVERFEAPRGLTPGARAAWADYWRDRQSALLTESSKAVLRRWVRALDRYLRCSAAADAEPLVVGSTGQTAMNPLYRVAEMALKTVTECERQLGIGGLNAANLGLAAVSEQRGLADLNSRYLDADGGDEDDGDADDPRTLRVIDV